MTGVRIAIGYRAHRVITVENPNVRIFLFCLGNASDPAEPVENISCVSDSFEDMMCEYCDPDNPPAHTHYTFKYRIG